jgi:hypothetical protein
MAMPVRAGGANSVMVTVNPVKHGDGSYVPEVAGRIERGEMAVPRLAPWPDDAGAGAYRLPGSRAKRRKGREPGIGVRVSGFGSDPSPEPRNPEPDHGHARDLGQDGGGAQATADPTCVAACSANALVVLVCNPTRATVTTRDASDRAHTARDDSGASGFLMTGEKAKDRGIGKPRKYPPSQMTSRGVAFDSAYDQLHARQRMLGEIGVRGVGIGDDHGGSSGVTAEMMIRRAGYEAAKRKVKVSKVIEAAVENGGRGGRLKSAERVLKAWRDGTWSVNL